MGTAALKGRCLRRGGEAESVAGCAGRRRAQEESRLEVEKLRMEMERQLRGAVQRQEQELSDLRQRALRAEMEAERGRTEMMEMQLAMDHANRAFDDPLRMAFQHPLGKDIWGGRPPSGLGSRPATGGLDVAASLAAESAFMPIGAGPGPAMVPEARDDALRCDWDGETWALSLRSCLSARASPLAPLHSLRFVCYPAPKYSLGHRLVGLRFRDSSRGERHAAETPREVVCRRQLLEVPIGGGGAGRSGGGGVGQGAGLGAVVKSMPGPREGTPVDLDDIYLRNRTKAEALDRLSKEVRAPLNGLVGCDGGGWGLLGGTAECAERGCIGCCVQMGVPTAAEGMGLEEMDRFLMDYSRAGQGGQGKSGTAFIPGPMDGGETPTRGTMRPGEEV